MLYDLDFLKKGKEFPPKSELKRIKGYEDNLQLYNGEWNVVLEEYRTRLVNILNKFNLCTPETAYLPDTNYWQLISTKTAGLTVGEPPNINAADESAQKSLNEAINRTDFNNKLYDLVLQLSICGDGVIRILPKVGGADFIIADSAMWYPIVNRENIAERLADALIWVVEKGNTAELHAQIHTVGNFENRLFTLKEGSSVTDFTSGETIAHKTYIIGDEIGESRIDNFKSGQFATGLKVSEVINFTNSKTPNSIYGKNDYDIVTSVIAELQLRLALENVVLDKHSAPSMYGPPIDGEVGGNYIEVREGMTPPAYLTWDSCQTAVAAMITELKQHLFNLSEMGVMLSDDTLGDSQGYDALEIKLTNARIKARSLSNRMTGGVKKLLSALTDKGAGSIAEKDISVYWNDGIPNNEYRETDIAQKQLNIKPLKTIYTEQFGYTDEEAEKLSEEMSKQQTASSGVFSFNGGVADGNEE